MQLEKLLGLMEEKRWLATGHARTANARIKSRVAWEEIAVTLNSDGGGSLKTWQQWCKYWKDKKGGTKRKASAISIARCRTGGGVEEVPELSDIDLRILSLMGGESFATGDRELTIDPFNCISESIIPQGDAVEEFHVQWNESVVAVLGEGTMRDTMVSPPPAPSSYTATADPPPLSSAAQDEMIPLSGGLEPQPPQECNTSTSPPLQREILLPRHTFCRSPSEPAMRRQMLQQHVEESANARHRVLRSPILSAARRRLLRRSPPSQRRSEMASLTNRFVAIEERRVEAEIITARSQERIAQSQQAIASSVAQLAHGYASHSRAISDGQQAMASSVAQLATAWSEHTKTLNTIIKCLPIRENKNI